MAFSYSHLLSQVLFLCFLAAQSADPSGQYCNDNTHIPNGSKISSNINNLLSELVQKTAQNGFATSSYGSGEDRVYGLAQCREDVSTKDCSNCTQEASKQILKSCPDQADARIWYEYCFLRYNNKTFFGQVDTSFGIIYYNVQNVTDPEDFNRELGSLMDQISSQATRPGNKGLGTGKTKLSPFITLYALVQCTNDLSDVDCAQCLAIAIGNFATICHEKKGCRVLYSSCYVRYELYPFFFPLDPNNNSVSTAFMTYQSTIVHMEKV